MAEMSDPCPPSSFGWSASASHGGGGGAAAGGGGGHGGRNNRPTSTSLRSGAPHQGVNGEVRGHGAHGRDADVVSHLASLALAAAPASASANGSGSGGGGGGGGGGRFANEVAQLTAMGFQGDLLQILEATNGNM